MSNLRRRVNDASSSQTSSSPSFSSAPFSSSSSSSPTTTTATGSLLSFLFSFARVLFYLCVFLFLLVVGVLVLLVSRNGGVGGAQFPDRAAGSKTLNSEKELQVVARLPSPPGNVAASSDGRRVFFTFHPEYKYPVQLAVLNDNNDNNNNDNNENNAASGSGPLTAFTAYPSLEFQSTFASLLAVRTATLTLDSKDKEPTELLFALDFAHFGASTPALYSFYTTNNTLHSVYYFPSSVVGLGSMLNDFHVSESTGHLFIADTSMFADQPGLVIYNVHTRVSRKILHRHHSMRFQNYVPRVNGVPVVAFGLFVIRPSIDTIALSPDSSTLYYAPVAHENLFAIDVNTILDEENDEETYEKSVKVVGNKTISDGAVADNDFVYLTDFEHNSIVLLPLNNKAEDTGNELVTLVSSSTLLRWPDGLSFGPPKHGHRQLYITNSILHHKFAGEDIQNYAPFHIVKIALPN